MTTERVSGHELRCEGAAYAPVLAGRAALARVTWGSTAGTGVALCSCGDRSPILPSANQRKAWHRAHKAEVVSGAQA